jgi:hypothetical protein
MTRVLPFLLVGVAALSPEARALIDAFVKALQRAGIVPKEAAALMGISETNWNHQRHGRHGQHVSLGRIGSLVSQRPDVLTLWLQEMATLVDAEMVTNDAMRSLIDQLQVLILQSQAAELKRPVLKADLVNAEAKERVS